MKQWKIEMEKVAESVEFVNDGYALSKELFDLNQELEKIYDEIRQLLDGRLNFEKSISICSKMIDFYDISQDLLEILIIELNKKSFAAHVHKMSSFFSYFNKVLKLCMQFDLLKIQNPIIFAIYCENRLLYPQKSIEGLKDLQISTFHSISIPLGRLFLSYFANQRFDLVTPSNISKIAKVMIDKEKIDNLAIFLYLSRKNNWKYLDIFLSVCLNRLLGKYIFDLSSNNSEKIQKYFNLLSKQL